ncbi:MAG: hypothetical protein WAV51_02460 [Microgenomates group bacterium]
MANIECLRDCNAHCCRKHVDLQVIFFLSSSEVAMFQQKGVTLTPKEGGYIMPDDCVFLTGNSCELHETPNQPNCCTVNVAGQGLCTGIRAAINGKRFSEVE